MATLSPDEEIRVAALELAQKSLYGGFVVKDKKKHAEIMIQIASVYEPYIRDGSAS